MQITCPGCGEQLPISDHHRGMKVRCGGCDTLVDVPLASQPITHSYPVPVTRPSNHHVSDNSIIITALCCMIGLILVVGVVILLSSVAKDPPQAIVDSVQEESESSEDRTSFPEGYSLVLPSGFKQESREVTERGYIVYRFRSSEGYKFTFAIIPKESIDRFTTPPKELSQALVKSVPELSEGVEGDVQPKRVTADRMAATVFRYYETETYRGVTFTYLMVALDPGRKLVLKFAGKYGGYNEQDENIMMPQHWYHSLMTLRREP